MIWLRTGNTSSQNLAAILTSQAELIKAFLLQAENQEIACLEITK